MVWNKTTSIKVWIRIQRILWLLFILVGGLYLTQNYWQPKYYEWRCAGIAAELTEKYGIVVRYGDPSEFFVPPGKPLENNPEEGFLIEPSNMYYAINALDGVRSALSIYPPNLIQKHLNAVFVAGMIKTYGTEIGASYHKSWIFLSALKKYELSGGDIYELNLHHEFSSLLINGENFPSSDWVAVNAPNFKYPTKIIDVVQAAAIESRKDPKDAHLWYQSGFVHDYGMSSLNNDFNMYAELAMTHPQRLKKLSLEYPRIHAKTQILVEFYTSLAPELGAYFKSVGLAGASATD